MNVSQQEVSSTGDWYLDSVDAMQRSAEALKDSLDRTIHLLQWARDQRVAGETLETIVRGLMSRDGLTTRRSHEEAFRVFNKSVTAYRAVVIRALVEEEGMTLSDLARLLGVSRQMIGRLFRAAAPRSVS
jgi:transcriptional regulator GlxA family with amidase domain